MPETVEQLDDQVRSWMSEELGSILVAGLVLAGVTVAGLALGALVARATHGRVAAPSAARQPGTGQQAALFSPLGRQVFAQVCARCHGVNAEGGTGPPLVGTGLSRQEIEATVRQGRPPFMPAFAQQLSPAQVQAVASYVSSLSEGASSVQGPRGAPGSGSAPPARGAGPWDPGPAPWCPGPPMRHWPGGE